MRVFFGSAQEYKEVAHLFCAERESKPTADVPIAAVPRTGEALGAKPELTPELIETALSRLPLSGSQRLAIRAVVDKSPNWISTVDLAKEIGLSRQQIAGVWGALGRRFANTDGWPKDAWPIDTEWDEQKKLWRYRALPALTQLVAAGRIKL